MIEDSEKRLSLMFNYKNVAVFTLEIYSSKFLCLFFTLVNEIGEHLNDYY